MITSESKISRYDDKYYNSLNQLETNKVKMYTTFYMVNTITTNKIV